MIPHTLSPCVGEEFDLRIARLAGGASRVLGYTHLPAGQGFYCVRLDAPSTLRLRALLPFGKKKKGQVKGSPSPPQPTTIIMPSGKKSSMLFSHL